MAQLSNTLATYLVRIRRYLRETTAAKSHWTDDFLKQLFNVAYRRRCANLIAAHEGYFTIVATTDLIAEQEKYAFPSQNSRIQKLELVRSDGSTTPIQRFERHLSKNSTSQSGGDTYFPTWRPISNGFVLEPAPGEDVTGGIRMEYTGTPVELTADGDALHADFPVIYDELLVLDTAIMALDQESTQEIGQSNNLLRLRAEYEQDFETFIEYRIISNQRITPFIPSYLDG